VTHAEANPLTGNLLIVFEPRQTSAPEILQALPALRLDRPVPLLFWPGVSDLTATPGEKNDLPLAVGPLSLEPSPAAPFVYKTGTGRVLYKTLGWSSVGMAVVGVLTPGIPGAPFAILAGYFFARSSPEAHQWLRQSRWFGAMVRDWEAYRGVRRGTRNAALALIGGGMVVTTLLGLPAPLTATILALEVVGLAIVLHLRVVEPPAATPVAAGV
jgi:uncharacterized membrane protein YbaN (DUF454 family)